MLASHAISGVRRNKFLREGEGRSGSNGASEAVGAARLGPHWALRPHAQCPCQLDAASLRPLDQCTLCTFTHHQVRLRSLHTGSITPV